MEEIREDFLPYKVVYRPGSGEYEEKKSRFIANIAPAASEEEAVCFIDSMRKKYYDARHNCSAWIIGRKRELTRCSDDGEPGGTAGRPMLEVLSGQEVTNAVLVVTRYFGGTLLGTGGLVRSYTQAAKAAVENAGIVLMRYGVTLTVVLEYGDLGRVQYLLGERGIEIGDSRYTQKVELDIRIPKEEENPVKKALIQATSARAQIQVTGYGYYMDR